MAVSRRSVSLLLALIDEAYERRSWHGPNLRGALRGVEARQAAWQPAPGRHSIQEIALHAAYWKHAAWRRITGGGRSAFVREGSNWFQPSPRPDEASWRHDRALLAACHRRLRAAVASLADDDLERTAMGGRETVARLVRGVAAHDLYHAGQIQLLKRLAPASPARRAHLTTGRIKRSIP